MIGRLNHVAIAVRDLESATRVYRDTLGAKVSAPVPLPEHGVTTVFVTLPNTKIELIAPLGADSPIEKFLERNPDGGMHHICFEVDDISAARDQLKVAGRAGAGRRRAEDRRARKTRAFPASEGLFRHPDRARTGLTHMAVSTAIAIYFLIWWIVLFAVLPWGVRAQGEGGAPGTDPGSAGHRKSEIEACLDDGRDDGDLRCVLGGLHAASGHLDDLATLFGLLR